MSQNDFDDVGEFHKKFELPYVSSRDNYEYHAGPRCVSRELLEFRLKFMLEELLEFAEAHGYTLDFTDRWVFLPNGENVTDHAKAFDALIDLNYVSLGTAHLYGYPWHPGWEAVQIANMAKERCKRAEDSARGSTWDVIKPKGWKAPDIAGILRHFGWKV